MKNGEKLVKFYQLGFKSDHTNWGWYYYKNNSCHGPFDTCMEMIDAALGEV